MICHKNLRPNLGFVTARDVELHCSGAPPKTGFLIIIPPSTLEKHLYTVFRKFNAVKSKNIFVYISCPESR